MSIAGYWTTSLTENNMSENPDIGKIGWLDLTVDDAGKVRDFYQAVVGWEVSAVNMGEYEDYCMAPPAEPDQPVAGVCHRRGPNENIPSRWLMYITVADLAQSIVNTEKMGGHLVCPERDMGSHGKMCVIQDPAGAVCALIEPAK